MCVHFWKPHRPEQPTKRTEWVKETKSNEMYILIYINTYDIEMKSERRRRRERKKTAEICEIECGAHTERFQIANRSAHNIWGRQQRFRTIEYTICIPYTIKTIAKMKQEMSCCVCVCVCEYKNIHTIRLGVCKFLLSSFGSFFIYTHRAYTYTINGYRRQNEYYIRTFFLLIRVYCILYWSFVVIFFVFFICLSLAPFLSANLYSSVHSSFFHF